MTLAAAAAALAGASGEGSRQARATVERRLYDIGSILGAVGLVAKTYLGKRCAQHTAGLGLGMLAYVVDICMFLQASWGL